MNNNEKEMIAILEELKEKYGVFQIKAEFEAEGSRMEELMRLKDITSTVGLPIILKIGGVEAITDIYNALAIGVKGLIAPMAETPFALSKFLGAIKNFVPKDNANDIQFAFNLETITAYENFDRMLTLPDLNLLSGMTIGRVDLVGSMNKNRDYVESDDIFEICCTALNKAKTINLETGLGGAISTKSIDFIKRLNDMGILNKFETRKVVFQADSVKYGAKAITKAVEFELCWLKSKRRFYSGIKAEDESRILMIERRLNEGE